MVLWVESSLYRKTDLIWEIFMPCTLNGHPLSNLFFLQISVFSIATFSIRYVSMLSTCHRLPWAVFEMFFFWFAWIWKPRLLDLRAYFYKVVVWGTADYSLSLSMYRKCSMCRATVICNNGTSVYPSSRSHSSFLKRQGFILGLYWA